MFVLPAGKKVNSLSLILFAEGWRVPQEGVLLSCGFFVFFAPCFRAPMGDAAVLSAFCVLAPLMNGGTGRRSAADFKGKKCFPLLRRT